MPITTSQTQECINFRQSMIKCLFQNSEQSKVTAQCFYSVLTNKIRHMSKLFILIDKSLTLIDPVDSRHEWTAIHTARGRQLYPPPPHPHQDCGHSTLTRHAHYKNTPIRKTISINRAHTCRWTGFDWVLKRLRKTPLKYMRLCTL